MALTGFLLIVFVLGHMAGNLLIFVSADALNHYAAMLKGNPRCSGPRASGCLSHSFCIFTSASS